jgi:hypothetical protein
VASQLLPLHQTVLGILHLFEFAVLPDRHFHLPQVQVLLVRP